LAYADQLRLLKPSDAPVPECNETTEALTAPRHGSADATCTRRSRCR
jgi:hypothetical protein